MTSNTPTDRNRYHGLRLTITSAKLFELPSAICDERSYIKYKLSTITTTKNTLLHTRVPRSGLVLSRSVKGAYLSSGPLSVVSIIPRSSAA